MLLFKVVHVCVHGETVTEKKDTCYRLHSRCDITEGTSLMREVLLCCHGNAIATEGSIV